MNYHLIILVHGLWGSKNHFEYIQQQIEEYKKSLDGNEQLVIYRTSDNEGYKTLDGIDVCGLRVAKEIKEEISHLNGDKGRVTKLSIVGYSLGGLISRYAIGVLYHQDYFSSIEPINFTTFCTPHVGVLTPGSNVSVKFFNWIIPNLLSSSGKQMFLKDSAGAKMEPLLASMANPSSIFYKALQAFKYRSLYANAINDKRTSWWTAGISTIDPFIKIDETSSLNDLDFKFIEGYEPIVIDANAKIIISNRPVEKDSPMISQSSNFWARKFKWLTVATNLLIVAPIWVTWFIISGLMETFKSHRRIKTTLKDYHSFFTSMTDWAESTEQIFDAGDNLSDVDVDDTGSTTGSIKAMQIVDSAIDQHLHDKTDTFMESVFDAITSKDSIEAAKIQQYGIKALDSESDSEKDSSITDSLLSLSIKTSIVELTKMGDDNEALRVFSLGLSSDQCEIINNLNSLEWQKFPILIRNTKSTHSASIVRNIDEKELYEGKVVIKHWLSEVLKME